MPRSYHTNNFEGVKLLQVISAKEIVRFEQADSATFEARVGAKEVAQFGDRHKGTRLGNFAMTPNEVPRWCTHLRQIRFRTCGPFEGRAHA